MYEVLKYIHENIKDRLSVEDISKQFGYSKWYFCKKFHQYTGKNFIEYVRHYRLSLAAIDILCGVTATDVAFKYGYDTIGGFNKSFLAEFGCLPREYKKQAAQSKFYYERRKAEMYKLTNRCEVLKEIVTGKNSYEDYYCMQHRIYSDLGMIEAANKNCSNTEIIASGIVNVLNNFTPVIIPNELIVGFNFPDSKYNEYFAPNDTQENRRLAKLNGISDDDINLYFKLKSQNKPIIKSVHPNNITQSEHEANEEWSAIGRCIDGNHSVINYEKVLKCGFSGILTEISKYESKNGTNDLYKAAKKFALPLAIWEKNMPKKHVK